MQRGGNAISIFISRLIFLPAFSSVFHCTSAKNVKTLRFLDIYAVSPNYQAGICKLKQSQWDSTSHWWGRIAIITNISVTPFNVWWQKTKENKLCQEHKELLALCIANRNMKYLSLCLRLVFHHKGKSGIAIWHNCSYVWYTLKSIEN